MTRAHWRAAAVAPFAIIAALVSTANLDGASSIPSGPPQAFSVLWVAEPAHTNKVGVDVAGIGPAVLRQVSNWKLSQWQGLLSVYAEQGGLIADVALPAMSGTYRIHGKALRFDPQFPLEPGLKYRAVFRPNQLPGHNGAGIPPLIAIYETPPRPTDPTTVVTQIYPTTEVVPENLLKFYVHFSAPMSRGRIYDHIHLRDEAGKEIELPFLEIDEELWNRPMTRLTLFIDPGRIKREVRPLEEIGPALEEGKGYSLIIDREWRDASGNRLKQAFTKIFKAGPPDRTSPDPATWKIEAPGRETRGALTVTFPKPMDHALAQRITRVADDTGKTLAGEKALADQERRWTFIPAQAWRRGRHKLMVETTIEDLAGNNIGKPFEVDLFDGIQRRFTNATATILFEVP